LTARAFARAGRASRRSVQSSRRAARAFEAGILDAMGEALGTILASLRLESAMMSRAHLRGRFGVHSTGAPGIIVHGIAAGQAVLARDAAPDAAVTLEAGDVVLLPRGDAHTLAFEAGAATIPLRTLTAQECTGITTLSYGPPREAETRIVCGRVTLDHPAAEGVMALLPEVIVARAPDGARKRWVLSTLTLLDEEPWPNGTASGVRSLVDALFVHALGSTTIESRSSLLAAARDEHIGRALALVHDAPGEPWTASELARRVGMSRTRFFDRFTALLGEPPARYLARWRVHAAADLMRRRDLSTTEVAERVGYSSEDALAKVFRRYVGVSPTEWRKRSQAGLA
jgi:AraC-like DNA-binding protein